MAVLDGKSAQEDIYWAYGGPVASSGWRLYVLLALFDRRDGTYLSELVRTAREGYERSSPDMAEDDAWDEFDSYWSREDSKGRLFHASKVRYR